MAFVAKMFALTDRGVLPKGLAKVSPQRRCPPAPSVGKRCSATVCPSSLFPVRLARRYRVRVIRMGNGEDIRLVLICNFALRLRSDGKGGYGAVRVTDVGLSYLTYLRDRGHCSASFWHGLSSPSSNDAPIRLISIQHPAYGIQCTHPFRQEGRTSPKLWRKPIIYEDL